MSVSDGLGKAAAVSFLDGQIQLLNFLSKRTMAGHETWTEGYRQVQVVDPGGSARNVTLPAEQHGLWYLVVNNADATEAITVKNDAGTNVVVVGEDEAAFIWCDENAAWQFFVLVIDAPGA